MGWGNLSHNLVLARTYRYERIAMMMIMTRRDSPSLNKSAIAEQENNIDSSLLSKNCGNHFLLPVPLRRMAIDGGI